MKLKPLKPGDKIAVIAPASPYLNDDYERIISNIKRLDLNPVLLQTCYKTHGHFAGTDIERIHDLHEAFSNSNYQGIFCLKGGYGTPRLLKHMDMDLIKSNIKPFLGYSDITALHIHLNNHGIPTFHGPMASSPFIDEYTIGYMKKALFSTEPYTIVNPTNEKLDVIYPGQCSGQLVGGNLSLLISTLGSPYEINAKDKILFIEEVNEPYYVIDRMLTSLDLAGKFDDAAGIILGTFEGCGSDPDNKRKKDLPLSTIIKEIILPYKKTMVGNFRAGHNFPQPTLPFGQEVSLNTNNFELKILK